VKLRTRLIATAAALGLALTGCSSLAAGPKSQDDTLRVAAVFFPVTLDPTEGIDSIFSFAETLTRVDDGGEVQPLLLASLPERTAPTRWTLTLRPDITFQNGRPADAAAVAASLTRAVTDGISGKASLPGTTFKASGTDQILVVTPKPQPLLPYTLADIGFAVHDVEVALAANGDATGWVGKGAFTAPYQIVEFDTRSMRLSAYPDYWQGAPALEKIDIRHVPEAQARVAAVQSGQVDLADGANVPDVLTAIQGNASAELTLSEAPLSSVRVFFNQTEGPLADLSVRRAVAHGLDYEALATDFTGGVGEPAQSLLPSDHPMAEPVQVHDPDEAERLLDAAGWKVGDGVREKDGKRLTVTLLSYNERPEFKPLSIGIQSQLAEIGVEVKLVSQPFDYKMYDDAGSWDLALYSEYAISPTGTPDGYLATYLATDGSANLWKIGDPELDRLVSSVATSPTEARRDAVLRQVQQRVFDQAYLAVLAFERDGALVRQNWSSYRPGDGYRYATFDWKTAPAS
jgi:peptide/nickel transport system substrate-binding protein